MSEPERNGKHEVLGAASEARRSAVRRAEPVQPAARPAVEDRRPPLTGGWPIPGGVRPALRTSHQVPDRGHPRHRAAPDGKHGTWSVVRPAAAEQEPETVAIPVQQPDPFLNAPAAIEVKGLRKSFGKFTAVDDVSFRVPEGSVLALLGPNGAGKTTVVSMLTTLIRPDEGTASVGGCSVIDDPAGVRRRIMLTGQFAALDESLTGRENLVMFGRLLGLKKSEAKKRADELLAMFDVEYAANRKVREYSGGMRRRIDIACGLVTEPKVVFLDEPTTGLDPRSRQDVWTLVEQMRDAGVTVLLTTQYLEEADVLSDNIVVIDHGKVIAEGTSDELKAQTGAAYCEITPAHPAYLPRLRGALKGLGLELTEDNDTISVPAAKGAETLALVISCTEAADVPLADISLRRPSLDEVFFALTGDDKS
ncbi:ATP-binding cassette domain-containing protein [Gordonia sp. (in: high G+C Gram-positive bacteria)]|uniref:ATP-binding cassette domain-containing protein n=1 Tax=Gordonia sp. (in: high G+C Gram-positive bacteria) TaxID=84139 RepID=UPI003526CE8A